MQLDEIFQQAVKHQQVHDCSAHPYEDGGRLFALAENSDAKIILEIGTGIGYTTLVLAEACPEAKIISLEKDTEHSQMAKEFIAQHNPSANITVLNEIAEEYLPASTESFDLIFFDGFQIHYEFIPQYYRLLKPGGLLVVGNNHLTSKTSDQFYEELNDASKWDILERFSETIVAKRVCWIH